MINNVIKLPQKKIEDHTFFCNKHHDQIIKYLEDICGLTRSKQGAVLLLYGSDVRAIIKSVGEVSEKIKDMTIS